ncbi:hypothetical protein SSS_08531, partial [Sarcoptes scabiei]
DSLYPHLSGCHLVETFFFIPCFLQFQSKLFVELFYRLCRTVWALIFVFKWIFGGVSLRFFYPIEYVQIDNSLKLIDIIEIDRIQSDRWRIMYYSERPINHYFATK